MTSLKELLKEQIFSIYPYEMSSRDVEKFAYSQGYNAETGRKRMSDLRADGLVSTREEIVRKCDGKNTNIAFHKAIVAEPQKVGIEVPLWANMGQCGSM